MADPITQQETQDTPEAEAPMSLSDVLAGKSATPAAPPDKPAASEGAKPQGDKPADQPAAAKPSDEQTSGAGPEPADRVEPEEETAGEETPEDETPAGWDKDRQRFQQAVATLERAAQKAAENPTPENIQAAQKAREAAEQLVPESGDDLEAELLQLLGEPGEGEDVEVLTRSQVRNVFQKLVKRLGDLRGRVDQVERTREAALHQRRVREDWARFRQAHPTVTDTKAVHERVLIQLAKDYPELKQLPDTPEANATIDRLYRRTREEIATSIEAEAKTKGGKPAAKPKPSDPAPKKPATARDRAADVEPPRGSDPADGADHIPPGSNLGSGAGEGEDKPLSLMDVLRGGK